MKVLQVTNTVSHHQLPLAIHLARIVGSRNFRIAVTGPPNPARIAMGWDGDAEEEWLLKPGERRADVDEYLKWWESCDFVLCGERVYELLKPRLAAGKLAFYMSERWWKPQIGVGRLLYPPFLRMALAFRALATSSHFHYLPMGAYAANDMRVVAPFPNRMWRWGYFPPEAARQRAVMRNAKSYHIMWAGRMLDWKRVDTLLRGFRALVSTAVEARLTLVGNGPTEPRLKKLATDLGLLGHVIFLPSQPAREVRRLMRTADVFVLASNGCEGWGAVINEAMSEGCVVVASSAAGAAKTLIRDGENGVLFRPGDWRQLGSILCTLRTNGPMRDSIAVKARRTIAEEWSPGVAAARLLAVTEALLSGTQPPRFDCGPMCGA